MVLEQYIATDIDVVCTCATIGNYKRWLNFIVYRPLSLSSLQYGWRCQAIVMHTVI